MDIIERRFYGVIISIQNHYISNVAPIHVLEKLQIKFLFTLHYKRFYF